MFFVVYLKAQNALLSRDSETQHTSAEQLQCSETLNQILTLYFEFLLINTPNMVCSILRKMFTTSVALNNVQPTCNFEITHLAHKIFESENRELGYGQDNPGLNSQQRQEIVLFSKTFRLVWESPSLLQ